MYKLSAKKQNRKGQSVDKGEITTHFRSEMNQLR